MSGGFEELVYNPSERAVSDDANRAQRFKGKDVAEIFRALLDTFQGSDDVDASGSDTQTVATGTPPSAAILSGFRVVPQIGAGVLSLLVDPGVAFLYDPDGSPNPDESQYKFVRDAGVPSAGSLLMTPNASGSIRIDVVECARVAAPGYEVLEVDSRDIFDQTTGLFTAQSVNKVIQGALQYRVRAGTAGSGYPGAAAGWLPLAIASVASGSTTCDTMTFWDVRPLVADRVIGPSNVVRAAPKMTPNRAGIDTTTGGKALLNGDCDVGTRFGLHRLGGNLLRGTPGTDGPADLMDSANWADTISGNGFAYAYLLEPFGLPRWARYTDVGAGHRLPRSPRGIAVVSQAVAPLSSGAPTSAVQLPTSTGLGGSTTQGVCVASVPVNSGAIIGLASDGVSQWGQGGFWSNNASAAASSDVATFTCTPGVAGSGAVIGYPPVARSLHLALSLELIVTAGSGGVAAATPTIIVSGAGNTVYEMVGPTKSAFSAAGGTLYVDVVFTVPIPLVGGVPAAGFTLKVKSFPGAGVTFNLVNASLLGWGL